ncbi:MAG TPA: hypothetical protein VFL04_01290 [Rectinemataceae bacterium]|nr:hypothetical protein [Rectinemataceae bacterium]
MKDGPLVLGLELGIGAESETGLPWAVEPSLALDADWDRYYARIELSQAFGELDWQRVLGYRVLDTAGMAVGWRPELADRLDLRLEAFSRYRSFGGAGYEARFGALALLQAGAMRGEAGPFFIAGAGYSRLMTRYSGTAVSQWDNDPLARIGFGWRDGRRLVLDMAISDYTGADASLWLKTFFEFGGRLAFGEGEAPEARATLVLKYSDFFTLTSYLDGFALRLSMSLPLGSPAWSAGLTGI